MGFAFTSFWGLVVHVMIAHGLMFGPGYASAADVGQNTGKLIALEIDAADYTICMENEVDPQVVNYVTELERQYREATGVEYRHKPCSLLMKLRR